MTDSWVRPAEALRLATAFLDASQEDAATWLVTDLAHGRRSSRASLAMVYDQDPPREIPDSPIPLHLWDNPRPSAWVAEMVPGVPFGRSFWSVGNRDVFRDGKLAVRLVKVEIEVSDLSTGGEASVSAPPAEAAEPITKSDNKTGRPSKQTNALEIFVNRLRAGKVERNKAAEARAIVKLTTTPEAPKDDTVAKYLKPFHALVRWDEAGVLANADEVIARIEADQAD